MMGLLFYRRDEEREEDNKSTTSSENNNYKHVTEVYVDGDMKSRLFTQNRGGFGHGGSSLGGFKTANVYA